MIDRYIVALEGLGRPRTTIATRTQHVRRIARGLSVSPEDVSSELLVAWFATQTQWKRETRRSYRNSAAGFFRWAYREGHLPTNPAVDMPTVKPDKPVPRPAPDRIWCEAMMAADPRVMVMLRLAAEAGLRRAEVAQVRTRDLIEGFDGQQLLVHGKGDRDRIVPITDELAALIEAGAAGHSPGHGADGWLFPGDDDGHLSPRWVGKLCTKVMPGVWTLHTLRHRFLTRAYRGTRNLRAVQVLAGHSSIATTQRYLAVDESEVRAAMMAAAGGVVTAILSTAVAAATIIHLGVVRPGTMGCNPEDCRGYHVNESGHFESHDGGQRAHHHVDGHIVFDLPA